MRKKQVKQGSLTVEAALVLPIFIFAITAFLSFFQMITIQENLQMGLTETAKAASRFGYVWEDLTEGKGDQSMGRELVNSLVSGAFFEKELLKYIDREEIDSSCIEGGFKGISFLNSSFMEENDQIDIAITYLIRPRVPFFHFRGYPMVQRVKTRGFVGTGKEEMSLDTEKGEEEEQKEEVVYITETGTVYHGRRDCTHIKLSIRSSSLAEVEFLYNENRGRYKRCEICYKADTEQQGVYITSDGERYHQYLGCSGLKRTVITIKRSEAAGKRPCSRCGG